MFSTKRPQLITVVLRIINPVWTRPNESFTFESVQWPCFRGTSARFVEAREFRILVARVARAFHHANERGKTQRFHEREEISHSRGRCRACSFFDDRENRERKKQRPLIVELLYVECFITSVPSTWFVTTPWRKQWRIKWVRFKDGVSTSSALPAL